MSICLSCSIQISTPQTPLVSYKIALKTCFTCLRCMFSVCVCVCVFSVCVCLCISKDTLIMLVLVTTHATHAALNKITRLTQKSTPNTISLSYSTTTLFRPTNPCAKKLPPKFYFEFLYSIFFFLPPPMGFYFLFAC